MKDVNVVTDKICTTAPEVFLLSVNVGEIWMQRYSIMC